VVLILLSIAAQVVIGTVHGGHAERLAAAGQPAGSAALALSRVSPALVLFGAVWLLFISLTPGAYSRPDLPQMARAHCWLTGLVAAGHHLPAQAAAPPVHLRPDVRQPGRRHDRAFLFLADWPRDGGQVRELQRCSGQRHPKEQDLTKDRPMIGRARGQDARA